MGSRLRPPVLRRRQRQASAAAHAGFVGYSRSNAGSYHDRMVASRSRAQLAGMGIVAIVVVAAFICMLMAATWA